MNQKSCSKIKCRDMSCKVKKGFNSAEVMRNDKQKKKLAKQKHKAPWLYEDQGKGEGTKTKGVADIASLPKYINPETGEPEGHELVINGESKGWVEFIDIEQSLADPSFFTTTGRPRYVPGHMIPIREFIPEIHTPESPAFISYGKRRTGKSFFMRWFLWRLKDWFDQVFCFTETSVNKFWQGYIPEGAIYPHWDEGRAQQIIEFNTWVIENPDEAKRKGWTPNTITILDDVISSNMLRRVGDDGNYAALYVQGRHTKSSVGTNTQKATAIPPKVRDNIDLVFVLRQESDTERERIWREHMGRLNKRTAYELMELWTRTDNYETPNEERYTLVIDTHPCKSYNDRFFWAKAIDPGPFKLGSVEFWREMGKPEPITY